VECWEVWLRWFLGERSNQRNYLASPKAMDAVDLKSCDNPTEGVKELGRPVKRRYLQSFRIAVFDRHRSQGSAIEGK
jgi:hypothetical protein